MFRLTFGSTRARFVDFFLGNFFFDCLPVQCHLRLKKMKRERKLISQLFELISESNTCSIWQMFNDIILTIACVQCVIICHHLTFSGHAINYFIWIVFDFVLSSQRLRFQNFSFRKLKRKSKQIDWRWSDENFMFENHQLPRCRRLDDSFCFFTHAMCRLHAIKQFSVSSVSLSFRFVCTTCSMCPFFVCLFRFTV